MVVDTQLRSRVINKSKVDLKSRVGWGGGEEVLLSDWLKENTLVQLTKKKKENQGKARGFVSVKMECWSEELGKVSATFCSSRLLLCSSPTIPDVAHTPQSDSFSRLRTPPCRPCTSPEARSKLLFFSFFLFLSFSFFLPSFLPFFLLLAVAAYHLEFMCECPVWYCCANVKPLKIQNLCPQNSKYHENISMM